MAFNRVVIPSAAGTFGRKFAEFLGVDENSELEMTEMQSILYNRLFRLGAVRHLDGTRANRKRARERESAKRRKTNARKARTTRTRTARHRRARV